MVSTSSNSGGSVHRTLIPPTWTLQNFRDLFAVDIDFPLLFSPVFYLGLTVVGQMLTCAMAAFCFAVVKFKGRDFLFTLLLLTLMIPSQVTLIPNFIIFKFLGLVGTSIPLWLPAFWVELWHIPASPIFSHHSRDLVDAARIDGASLFQIFWKFTRRSPNQPWRTGDIHFSGCVNDLLHPLVLYPAVPNTTLTVGLAFFQQQLTQGGKFTVLMAGALISILPLVIVFFLAQKQFIEGLPFQVSSDR